MPPPGRPMLPSSSCRIAAVRMYCTPTVCCVQPTAYANAVVRSRPELSVSSSPTRRNSVLRDAADLARPSPACSGRSAASAPGTRSAGAAASRRARARRRRSSRRRSRATRRAPAAFTGCRRRGRRTAWSRCRRRLRPPRPRTATTSVSYVPARRVEAGEQAVEVLGVAEVLAEDRRAVGVRDDVLAEVALVFEDVVDERRRGTRCRCRRGAGRARRPPRSCG